MQRFFVQMPNTLPIPHQPAKQPVAFPQLYTAAYALGLEKRKGSSGILTGELQAFGLSEIVIFELKRIMRHVRPFGKPAGISGYPELV